jgi:hypothetical protein
LKYPLPWPGFPLSPTKSAKKVVPKTKNYRTKQTAPRDKKLFLADYPWIGRAPWSLREIGHPFILFKDLFRIFKQNGWDKAEYTRAKETTVGNHGLPKMIESQ